MKEVVKLVLGSFLDSCGMAGLTRIEERPGDEGRRGQSGDSPALTWLSLVGLLASGARLRFTKRKEFIAVGEISHLPCHA
jgi:hypothetical protein